VRPSLIECFSFSLSGQALLSFFRESLTDGHKFISFGAIVALKSPQIKAFQATGLPTKGQYQ
jgi:hypothetical protein